MYKKNTKIVCTLGPSSDSVSEITQLISAGMNVARLNFSHGKYEHHQKIINNLHKAEKETGKTIGIMQDLQGPKIRLGTLPKEGIEIKKGNTVIISTSIKKATINKKDEYLVPIQFKDITKYVKKGHGILIKDGMIALKAEKTNKTEIICKVKFGGTLETKNGVNFPDSQISIQTITAKDKKDLKFGLKNNVDYVALSFVKDVKDIEDLKKIIKQAKKNVQVIAKIERHEAIPNLKEIVKAADAIMVARGDLGTNLPAEQVPIIQKKLIHLANKYGKPVITATQVLQSMVVNSIATRAEISDAANAIFDKTDAIMLSNESAIGKYAARAVATLSKVATTIEKEIQKHEETMKDFSNYKHLSNINATCLKACEIAINTNADYIVAYTNDGYTTKQIAKHRPFTPIITITPDKETKRQLTLVWGVNEVYVKEIKNAFQKPSEILKYLKTKKGFKKNSKIIIVCNASKKESNITTCNI